MVTVDGAGVDGNGGVGVSASLGGEEVGSTAGRGINFFDDGSCEVGTSSDRDISFGDISDFKRL